MANLFYSYSDIFQAYRSLNDIKNIRDKLMKRLIKNL
jgi:hypothetical protein